MIKAGIIGGAGYTGGELLRLLMHHSGIEVVFVQSESQAGKAVSSVHQDLIGETDLLFCDDYQHPLADVVFICSGHGRSEAIVRSLAEARSTVIIDLSHDHRIRSKEHSFVYGLPEVYKEKIAVSDRIANPGCFATAISLGLVPLAANGKLPRHIYTQGITGSTGAGYSPTTTTHFSWRNNNVSVYKPLVHQHCAEILQTLTDLGPDAESSLHFIPVRGDFARGIMATTIIPWTDGISAAYDLFGVYYSESPFTYVTTENPHLKQVVGTNKCLVHLVEENGHLLIISMIDNLLKGASGQAVQNMNIRFYLNETAGLKVKAMAY